MKLTKMSNAAKQAIVGITVLLPLSAHAQVAAVTTKLTAVQTFLIGIGATVATIALIVGGWKMMFNKNTWGDVSHIFIGGAIVGVAAGVGAWLVT